MRSSERVYSIPALPTRPLRWTASKLIDFRLYANANEAPPQARATFYNLREPPWVYGAVAGL